MIVRELQTRSRDRRSRSAYHFSSTSEIHWYVTCNRIVSCRTMRVRALELSNRCVSLGSRRVIRGCELWGCVLGCRVEVGFVCWRGKRGQLVEGC